VGRRGRCKGWSNTPHTGAQRREFATHTSTRVERVVERYYMLAMLLSLITALLPTMLTTFINTTQMVFVQL